MFFLIVFYKVVKQKSPGPNGYGAFGCSVVKLSSIKDLKKQKKGCGSGSAFSYMSADLPDQRARGHFFGLTVVNSNSSRKEQR